MTLNLSLHSGLAQDHLQKGLKKSQANGHYYTIEALSPLYIHHSVYKL